MEKKTILHLEDNPDDVMLFKARLKNSNLLKKFGIDLITVENPKDAIKHLNNKHIDLVISDVKNNFASEDEVAKFLKVAHEKSKIMFYTNATYDELPKFENITYIPKYPSKDYYKGDSVDSTIHNKNVFNKIEETLTSNKKQKISDEAITKMTRPEYHVATPFDKEISKMLDNFKNGSLKKKEIIQALLEFKELRNELQSIKLGNHSQKHMNDIMDKYTDIVNKLKEFKKQDAFAFKAIKPAKQKETKIRETPKFKNIK